MLTYITRRLLLMVPTLIGITFLVFMLIANAPGGIGAGLKVAGGGAMQSSTGVAVQRAYLEDRYGLDDPVVVQYVRWLGRISPIKFGAPEQVSPTGEIIRSPRPIKDPPAWRWLTDRLPDPTPPALTISRDDPDAHRLATYRKAERIYADARGDYIAASTLFKEALGRYSVEAGIKGAVKPDGQARVARIERTAPNKSLKSWREIEELGRTMLKAYSAATGAQRDLAAAYNTRPMRSAGLAIIPGALNLSTPDLGTAYSRGRPVSELIATHLPVTLMLNLVAFPIIYMVAIPSGLLAAARRGSWIDQTLGVAYIALYSVPVVLAGVLAIGFLASKEYLGAFPASGLHDRTADAMSFLPGSSGTGFERGYLLDIVWHIALPILCLVYTGFAVLSKQTRAAMLDNYSADYVRTAKAKGVSGRDILFRHVFRNSLLPLITMFATIFPAMLAGSVVVERIFTVPGMGSLIIDAIYLRDRELLLANTAMIGAVNLLALLLADILYAVVDPRVSFE